MASFREVPSLRPAGPPRARLTATPTVNAGLPFRRGGFASLCAALDYAAQGETGLNFFDSRGTLLHVLPYARLRDEAQDFARHLAGAGVARGERLLLIAETAPDFCVAFFGAQYAGIVPVPVSTPVGLGAKVSFIEHLARQAETCRAVGILAPDHLAAYAREAAATAGVRLCGTVADILAMPSGSVMAS